MTIMNMVGGGGDSEIGRVELDIKSTVDTGLVDLSMTQDTTVKYAVVIDENTYATCNSSSVVSVVSRDGTSYTFTSPTTIKGLVFGHKTTNGIVIGIIYAGAQGVDRVKLIKYEDGTVSSEYIATSTSTYTYSILYYSNYFYCMPYDDVVVVNDPTYSGLCAYKRISDGYWSYKSNGSSSTTSYKYYNYADITGSVIIGSIDPSTQHYFSDSCLHRVDYNEDGWVDMGTTGIPVTSYSWIGYRNSVKSINLYTSISSSSSSTTYIVTENSVEEVTWEVGYFATYITLDPKVVIGYGSSTGCNCYTPTYKAAMCSGGVSGNGVLMSNKLIQSSGVYTLDISSSVPGYLYSPGVDKNILLL